MRSVTTFYSVNFCLYGHFLQKLVTFCNEYCYFKLFFYNDYIEIYFTNYVIPKRFSVV